MTDKIDELERRRDVLSKKIINCSKAAANDSCGDLISERNKLNFEISEINKAIKMELRRRKAAGEV